MPPSVEGPRQKLERAREHIHQIAQVADSFIESNPYLVLSEDEPQTGDRVWRIRVQTEPPSRIGILVGDAVHCLRATLDHLAWQLALLQDDDPPRRTEFPLFLDAQRYGKEAAGKIAGIPEEGQTLIEGLQPYRAPRPDQHPLWVIHSLDTTDKHRRIPVVSAYFPQGGLIADISTESASQLRWSRGAFSDGDVLLRVPRAVISESPQFFEPYFAFDVQLGDEPQPSVALIVRPLALHEFVDREVFPKFEHLFEG